jgi:hypothetical protein
LIGQHAYTIFGVCRAMDIPTQYPVFIMGSPRSGTSILVDGLRGAGYYGFGEGNFLSFLRVIERDIDRHYAIFATAEPNILISRIERQALKSALYKVICSAASEAYGNKPWIDKTGNPEMIEAIPILLDYWPQSRFIFAKRRAIENVTSRLKKFPSLNFNYHCNDWARNMSSWRGIRRILPQLRAIEVDQYEISHAPLETAARISRFLSLTENAVQRMASIFEGGRPQQTEAGSAKRILSLASSGWTAQQLEVFHAKCDQEMVAFGYTDDDQYWVM